MTREVVLEKVRQGLGNRILSWTEKSESRIYAEVAPADVPEATRLVFEDLGARFQTASGVDTPGAIEILYHWAFDAQGFLLVIRTKLDRERPEIQSVAGICTGTEWIEREMHELLGIRFHGHPDMRRLLLPSDWPEGQYPLRRDYTGRNEA